MTRTRAPERWRSKRLVFRRPEIDDAESIFFRYASDPEVTRFLGWPQHRTVDDSRRFIEFSICEWQRAPAGPYLIHLRDNGQLIGSTGFTFTSHSKRTALTGYVLARDAWGHGYATEALEAMLAVATELGLESLTAICHPDHARSIRVLEKCRFKPSPEQTIRLAFPNFDADQEVAAIEYQRRLGHEARDAHG